MSRLASGWMYVSYPFSFIGPVLPLGFRVAQLIKKSSCSAGDLGLIPGLGISPGEGNHYPLQTPGEGNGCPLQNSGLENYMVSIVHGVSKSRA